MLNAFKCRLGAYWTALGTLDARSLACFRIGVSLVVLYDIVQSWSLLEVWAGLHGFYDGLPLPALGGEGSQPWTLRLLLALWGLAAVGLLIGWRTRLCTLGVWLGACGHQYAASHTADYHDIALCNMLLWCQALHLGRRWSVDALRRRVPGPQPAERLAGAALVLCLAYIYLDTALQKTGPAWWSAGTALWYALNDIEAAAPPGRWVLAHLPFGALRLATHASWGIEAVAPLLMLSPWRRDTLRLLGCGLLVGLHTAMWVLMDIGPFPPTMIAGVAALLPTRLWDALGPWTAVRAAPEGPRRRRRLALWYIACIAALFGYIEGNRLAYVEDDQWPYPGAEWVARLRYFFALETEWLMYAPEPPAHTGWWVGVGRTADGREVDPITGAPPTLQKPLWGTPPFAGRMGYYWTGAPDEGGSPHRTYARYLLWLDRRKAPEERLSHFVLLYVWQPLWPPAAATEHYPLLVLTWPRKGVRPPLPADSILRRTTLYEVDYARLDTPGWRPTPLPPRRTY